jgi:hypothetical protein
MFCGILLNIYIHILSVHIWSQFIEIRIKEKYTTD